jgi:hypothetical protein
MSQELDPALYVPQAATALGLTISPQDLGDVVTAFSVLARVAAQVMATPLPEELVSAAVFRAADEDGA